MTNEEKYLGYLSSLRDDKNQKLIECVEEGFKTLVEYQVVGTMSERGVDLMENGDEVPEGLPIDIKELILKLTGEISELKDAMEDVADEHDEYSEENEERDEMEEAIIPATDGELIATSDEGQSADDRAYERSSSKEESGGSLDEKEPQKIPDVDPRDIDGIETGQRLGKVEGGRAPVTEYAAAVGLVGKLAAQYLAGAALDKLIDRIAGDSDSSQKAEMAKEVEEAAEKMRVSQTEGLTVPEELPDNVRKGESAGNEADDIEGEVANKQFAKIAEQTDKLAGSFEDKEELKAWVQAKITKAQETIDALYDYFNEEKGLDDKEVESSDNEDEEEVDESPIFEK